jgi:hypothetical protein
VRFVAGLLLVLPFLAADCKNGWQSSAEIGGDRIEAYLFSKFPTPLRFRNVKLYAGRKLLGRYKTDEEGLLPVHDVSPGEQRIGVSGIESVFIRIETGLRSIRCNSVRHGRFSSPAAAFRR